MKPMAVISVIALSCGLGTSAFAQSSYTDVKQGTVFTSAAVAGAVLGGPLGMMVGALGGAYLGEQIEQADEVDTMSQSLAVAEAEVLRLNQQLSYQREQTQGLQQLAMEALDFRVLFATASDTLTDEGRNKVSKLARVLQRYPQLVVRLDGYADPRGTDEYNNVLSHYRAESVRQALLEAGVEASRIEAFSHGSSHSKAEKGNLQAYAAERRVVIDVQRVKGADGLVMSDAP